MGVFPGLLLYHFSLTVSSSVCKRPSIIQSLVLQLAEAGSETTWKLQSLIIIKSTFCRSVIACFLQGLLGLSTMYYFTDYFLFETNTTPPRQRRQKPPSSLVSSLLWRNIRNIFVLEYHLLSAWDCCWWRGFLGNTSVELDSRASVA